MGTVSLEYDHHTRGLLDKLTENQHSHHKEIITALLMHLDAHHCLEVMVIKGKAKQTRDWLKNRSGLEVSSTGN